MPVYDALRLAVFILFGLAVALALGSWAVTSRRISPFRPLGRLIRRVSDPIVVPIERFLLGRGGNPRSAPWWLLGLVIVGGIALLTVGDWLIRTALTTKAAAAAGPRGMVRVVVYVGGQIVGLALIIRVVASWVGTGRYHRWLRPVYALTDWLVEPLRRIVPPIGIFDITPLIAWVLLQLVVSLVVRAI